MNLDFLPGDLVETMKFRVLVDPDKTIPGFKDKYWKDFVLFSSLHRKVIFRNQGLTYTTFSASAMGSRHEQHFKLAVFLKQGLTI